VLERNTSDMFLDPYLPAFLFQARFPSCAAFLCVLALTRLVSLENHFLSGALLCFKIPNGNILFLLSVHIAYFVLICSCLFSGSVCTKGDQKDGSSKFSVT
jgi:hypothetical protein